MQASHFQLSIPNTAKKTVEQAHDRLFVGKGAGLHNGAAQYLDEPASDGVDNNARDNARKRIGKEVRQKGKSDQTCRRAQF